MPAQYLELRKRVGSTFNGADSLVYVKTHWNHLDGKPSTFTPTSHALTNHTVSGLTAGHFIKATGSTTFGFAAHGLVKGDIGLGSVQNYNIATQAEAEAGTSNIKYITPLRARQAIDNHTPGTVSAVSTKTTWASTDVNTFFRMTNSSAITITIPTDATINYATGTEIHFMRFGAGEITFTNASGVSIYSEGSSAANAGKKRINTQMQVVTIKKNSANINVNLKLMQKRIGQLGW